MGLKLVHIIGLKILRDPSCFRPGKFSIVAGYYRTGSTLVFNQARLWLYLVLSFLFKKIHVSFCYIFCQQATGGENFYAGWQCDNVTQLRTEDLMCVKIVLPLRKITCWHRVSSQKPRTMLCKLHSLKNYFLDAREFDHLLMSRRSLRESLCSRMLEGLFCKKSLPSGVKRNSDEYWAFLKRCMTEKELFEKEVKKQCLLLMSTQAVR